MRLVFGLFAIFVPLVSAITMDIPENPTSGGSVHVTWTSASGDPPVFTLELANPTFRNSYAISNNVDTSIHELDVILPIVPTGPGYTLQAVNIGNITDVYAESGLFSIGGVSSVSGSSSSGSSSSSSGSVSGSTTRSLVTTTRTTSTAPVQTTAPVTTTTAASTATGTSFSSDSLPRFTFSASNAAALVGVAFAVLAGGAAVGL